MTAAPSRRLAAILAADIAGYAALVAADEAGSVRSLKEHQAAVLPLLNEHGGRVIDLAGDGILAEFQSAVAAVECALRFQSVMAERNAQAPPERAMRFRIGVNVGDVLYDETRLYGDGVNVAARLEAVAEPGGVCISSMVHDQVAGRVEARFVDLGEHALKNIARPVRLYAVQPGRAVPTPVARPAVELPDKPSIVVLPFTNMSGDPEQEYFADGITEDIITALSRVGWLFVIARNSSFTYKHRAVDVREVNRELGVRYVLEGSVRRSGTRLRITGQLIDARSGHHLWAGKVDGSCEETFELQDQVTEAVVGAVVPSVRNVEIEIAKHKPTDKLDAYDLYLRALPLVRSYDRGDNARAIAMLEDALQRAPEFARAAALASNAYCLHVVQGWQADASAQKKKGLELAERALRFGQDDPDTLAIAAWAYTWCSGRIDVGFDAVRRALSLNPNSTLACKYAGWLYCWGGDTARSTEFFEKASRLDPLDPDRHNGQCGIAWAHLLDRRFPEAVEWGYRAFSAHPGYLPTLRVLAAALAHANHRQEAAYIAARLLERAPNETVSGFAAWAPFRAAGPERFAIVLDGLRAAGIPE